MWRIPLSLLGGGGVFDVEPALDTYIGDLWVYLGSPSEPVAVIVRANAVDLAEIIIPPDFAAGSTFDFIATNNGRFIGTGGVGGDGGNDNGATGTSGDGGYSGGHAIQSDSFAVSIDIDDGFLLGGGGGGGGGSYDDTGAGGTPGGGGGGGAGWGDAIGGAAGSPTGSPLGAAGAAGSQTAFGAGGAGGSSGTNDGGDGAGYGYGGTYGQFANPSTGLFGSPSSGNGGYGGRAGAAFFPVNLATPTFNGAKSESTLRTESRLKGEIDGVLNLYDQFSIATIISSGTHTVGFDFLADSGGTLRKINTQSGNSDYSGLWYEGNSITPGDYEVRTVPGTMAGSWDISGEVDGDWIAISSFRAWEVSATDTIDSAASLFQIRRAGDTGGGDEGTMSSGFLAAVIEFEP
jgi:hypothetical protein